MARSLAAARDWVRVGTRLGADAVAGWSEDDLCAASALPGWSRKHLVAHLAANADAVGNLVRWAATGKRVPMYNSAEQRLADIETGARLPATELVAWFDRSAAALEAAMDALSEDRWRTQVVTAQGRPVPATETAWLRAREVMVHAVDLRAGLTFADLPADFLVALVDDIVAKRDGAGDGPALVVAPADHGSGWTVAGIGSPTPVTGSLAALAAYLAGRGADGVRTADGESLPNLPPWL